MLEILMQRDIDYTISFKQLHDIKNSFDDLNSHYIHNFLVRNRSFAKTFRLQTVPILVRPQSRPNWFCFFYAQKKKIDGHVITFPIFNDKTL